MDDRQYRVQLQRHRDELWVSGDPIRLKQVLCNLIQNAARYTPPGGLISISTARQDGFAQVQVSDNGIGISPEDQQRIFERFYRVDYARSRGNGGTGLGLSIVKHITAVHGGQVNVWSKPGQGSTFTIRLPEAAVQGADKESHPAASGQKDPERTS